MSKRRVACHGRLREAQEPIKTPGKTRENCFDRTRAARGKVFRLCRMMRRRDTIIGGVDRTPRAPLQLRRDANRRAPFRTSTRADRAIARAGSRGVAPAALPAGRPLDRASYFLGPAELAARR